MIIPFVWYLFIGIGFIIIMFVLILYEATLKLDVTRKSRNENNNIEK